MSFHRGEAIFIFQKEVSNLEADRFGHNTFDCNILKNLSTQLQKFLNICSNLQLVISQP